MPSLVDGPVSFENGMISGADPKGLPPGSYAWGVNVVNTGGTISTRPGYDLACTLPCGTLQGFTFFRPIRGRAKAVAFVDGQGYSASFPYTNFQPIPGAKMSAIAPRVYFESAVKSSERYPDKSIKLITPRKLLMIGDGKSPTSYYDGTSVKRAPGAPMGTWMKWSGSRLWIANRNRITPGDIGDPLSFIEGVTNTVGGTENYTVSGDVTGMAEVPGVADPAMLVFTAEDTTIFQSNIRDRDSWPATPNFQRILFPTLGCLSGLSISVQSGQLWWYSQAGTTRLDSAAVSFTSARTDIMDTEMARSKALLGDISRAAGAAFQGFFLLSVPHSSRYNAHTWVLNTSAIDLLNAEAAPGWCSVWTGIRPVQWAATGEVFGSALYVASKDFDGKNRIYRAFSHSQRDNGCDIPCAVELAGMTGGNMSPKRIRHANYLLAELAGQVNLRVLWAGAARGKWKELGSARLFSRMDAVVNSPSTLYDQDSVLVSLKRQSRDLDTEDPKESSEDAQTSGEVESPNIEDVDKVFSVRIEWTGRATVRAYRQFMDPEQETFNGDCDADDKSEENFVRADGAAGNTLARVAEDITPQFSSDVVTAKARYHNFSATATATALSSISQEDATKRATQIAEARADYRLRQIAEPFTGSPQF